MSYSGNSGQTETGTAFQVGDVIRNNESGMTWRITSFRTQDHMVELTGPGPCQSLASIPEVALKLYEKVHVE